MSNIGKHISLLVLIVTLVIVLGASASVRAEPSELFFSEYIEGSSFNKAIEIYNGTGSAIDLAAGLYTLELYSNGAASTSQSVALTGTLADGDVFVVAHGSADAAILAVADLISNSVINFNGDDAVVLRKNGAVVDAFGQIGFDPGSEWTGGGVDDTLRRAESVCAGDTNANDAFDASVEWIVFANNTFDGLGSHATDCNGGGAADPLINEFVFNHTGTDANEYVESFGDPNTDYSAFTVLQIEGDGSGAGVIDSVLPVGTTDANGFWTTGFLNNAFENGSVSLLLVEGFTGAAGNDLDADNNGVLETTPWDRLVDDVAVSDGGAGDSVYASTVLAPGFSGNPFTPGGASRIPNGTDTDSVADWTQNDFDGAGIPGFTGTPDAGEALNTPGAVNALVTVGPATNVIINEVDSDTEGTDALEFVELYDGGSGNTALDDLVVVFYNGSNDLSYAAFDLDGHSTDANGYFLLGNTGVSPTPGITFAGNFLQNGADAVALYTSNASDFPNDTAITIDNLIDAIVYDTNDADDVGLLVLLNAGQPQVNEGGGGNSAGHSNQRCPNGEGGARNTDTYIQAPPTPGAENACGDGEAQEAKIHEVQGSGSSVAITNLVIVEAVVVGDYQNDDQLRSFFIQEEDADADTDTNTSEGIFVFCGGCATDVAVGDLVQVTGLPIEFFGMSQIDVTGANGAVSAASSGNQLPTPAIIDLPAGDSTRAAATFENVEGMLVTFTDTLVVSEYFELARYGQLVLTADARPRQFTDANEPSVSGYEAFLEDLNSRRIILDDDNNIQNDAIEVGPDEPYFWPRPGLSITNFIRGGDSISSLTGVLHWSFAGQSGTDAWRVRPVEEAFTYEFTSNNERSAAPDAVGGSLKVASFNVLNYFTTINSRGADSITELDRQREKIAAAICAMDADIVGLIEIENNGAVAISDLLDGTNGINANCGPYNYIDTGVIGSDEIAVAFIYRTASVSPVGTHAILDSSVDPRFLDDFNRPVLAQTFQENAAGGIFTAAVNHLKSKGSDCNDVGDPDTGDGSGNCNLTRKAAAEALVDWLASDPTGSGDEDFLIIGDLNSYRNEDPIDAIEAGADDMAGTADDYTDLLDALIGPPAYTYVFDGQLGYLDHALANGSLLDQVTGVTAWHINADEIPVFDYNDGIDDGSNESSFERESTSLPIYEPNAYRSSDHDPVIVGLDLIATCSGLPATIVGTPDGGAIYGTTDPDVIVGQGGNDIIYGGNGNDVICGNGGVDTLYGDNGDDTLLGSHGNDSLDGGNGNDSLDGSTGNDTLAGNNGDDTLTGGAGADSFSGGQGNDTNTDFNAGEGDTSDGT